MALANLAAVLVLAAVVVYALAAAAPTDAYYSGGGAPGQQESCATQIQYFTNCLARDEIRAQCCTVVDNKKCLCQLKREVAVPCSLHRHHQRKCGQTKGPAVTLTELQRLPCFKILKC